MAGISFRLRWFDRLLETPNDDEHGNIDAETRAVAAVLFKHMKPNGWCKPGERTIARQAGLSKTTVVDRIRRLERLGRLVVERRNRAVNKYQAAIPSEPSGPAGGTDNYPHLDQQVAQMPPGQLDQRTTELDHLGVQTGPPGGHEPENHEENHRHARGAHPPDAFARGGENEGEDSHTDDDDATDNPLSLDEIRRLVREGMAEERAERETRPTDG